MGTYSANIITALGALNNQRNKVMLLGDSKEASDNVIEGSNATGLWAGSALAAIDARRQKLTAIIGLEDLAATTVDVQELLEPLVLPSLDNDVDNGNGGVASEETAEQSDDSDWDTIPSDDDADETTHDPPTTSPLLPKMAAKSPSTARKSRPTRRKGNNGVTFSDYGGVDTLIQSPTIIKLKDGSFLELRCDICGGNTSWAHNTVISGVRGFQAHYRLMHSTKVKVDDVLQRCKYRDVPAEEAERIIQGEHKIQLIHCESKVNLQSDMVYIGQSAVGSGNKPKRGARTVEELAAARADDAATSATATKTKRKRAAKPNDSAAESSNSSPPPSSQLKKKHKRDHSAPHLSNCPIIVQAPSNSENNEGASEDEFIELRCDVCHGNGSFSSGKLLYGIKGFKAHYREIHKEHLSTSEILARCRHREVPADEVRAIQAGTKGVGFVRCEGSPNVRPKKSYRDFVVREV